MKKVSAKLVCFFALFFVAARAIDEPSDDQKKALLLRKVRLICNSNTKALQEAVICDYKEGYERVIPYSDQFDPEAIVTASGRNGGVIYARVKPTGKNDGRRFPKNRKSDCLSTKVCFVQLLLMSSAPLWRR